MDFLANLQMIWKVNFCQAALTVHYSLHQSRILHLHLATHSCTIQYYRLHADNKIRII